MAKYQFKKIDDHTYEAEPEGGCGAIYGDYVLCDTAEDSREAVKLLLEQAKHTIDVLPAELLIDHIELRQNDQKNTWFWKIYTEQKEDL